MLVRRLEEALVQARDELREVMVGLYNPPLTPSRITRRPSYAGRKYDKLDDPLMFEWSEWIQWAKDDTDMPREVCPVPRGTWAAIAAKDKEIRFDLKCRKLGLRDHKLVRRHSCESEGRECLDFSVAKLPKPRAYTYEPSSKIPLEPQPPLKPPPFPDID